MTKKPLHEKNNFYFNFHGRGPKHIEITPLICRANQWTGFYMIEISVMKELKPRRDIFTTLLSTYDETFLRKWRLTAKCQFQYIYIYIWIFLDFRDRSRQNIQCVAFNRGHNFETLRSLMSWEAKKHKKIIFIQHHWR